MKSVVTAEDVRAVPAGGEVVATPGAVVTDWAREVATTRGVRIVLAAGTTPGPLLVAVGADHGGFALKEEVKAHLTRLGYRFHDFGTHSTDAVDYPDVARKVARAIRSGEARLGILVDGAGLGSAMAANKVRGIRAAPCQDAEGRAERARAQRRQRPHPGLGFRRRRPHAGDRGGLPDRDLHRGASPAAGRQDRGHRGRGGPMIDTRLVEAVVRAVLGELEHDHPCACHATPATLCPDRFGRMVGAGAERFGLIAGVPYPVEVARRIDHTLLKPEATREQIEKLCAEARQYALRHRLRESHLGAAVRDRAPRLADPGVHRGRLPPGRYSARGEGLRGGAGGGRRGLRGRHGPERGRPQVRRLSAGGARHRPGRGRVPRGGRACRR